MNPVKMLFSTGEFTAEINKNPVLQHNYIYNMTGKWNTWDGMRYENIFMKTLQVKRRQ